MVVLDYGRQLYLLIYVIGKITQSHKGLYIIIIIW